MVFLNLHLSLVWVGRISEQKAPDVFIKAAKQIKQKIPEACFMIVAMALTVNDRGIR